MALFLPVMLQLILKIFSFIIAGYILGRLIRPTDSIRKTLVNLLLYLLVPALFFCNLWASDIVYKHIITTFLSVTVVMGSGILFSYIYSKFSKLKFKEIVFPISSINSGYLGVPIITILFGQGAIAFAILYNFSVTLYEYTIGLYFISGRNTKKVFSLPILYLLILAIILNQLHINVPGPVLLIGQVINYITPPLMLAFVGYELSRIKMFNIKHSLIGSFLRLIGGTIAGFICILIFNPGPMMSKVILLISGMPSAVISYIFAAKYDTGKEFAATTVLLSTLLSIITLSITLVLIGNF